MADNGYNANWWSNAVNCWLGSNSTSFYFADNAGYIRRGSYEASNNSISVVNAGTNAQATKICSSWGANRAVKANGRFYSTDTTGYNNVQGSNTSTANLIYRGLEDDQDTVLTSVTVDRTWTNPVLSMSKDGNIAFITVGASDEWGWSNNQSTRTTRGAEVHKVTLNSSPIVSTRILQSSDKVWVSSISNVGSDGVYSFAGRDLNSALFTKINVSINANGQINRSNQATTSSDILTMIRL